VCITHITDVQILQIRLVVFDINDVLLGTAAVGCAHRIGTLHRLQMRERRILPGKLIHENLICLARALLYKRLGQERALGFLLRVAAIPANAHTVRILYIQIQIVAAAALLPWTKLHPYLVVGFFPYTGWPQGVRSAQI
jgi:hypothetical protein